MSPDDGGGENSSSLSSFEVVANSGHRLRVVIRRLYRLVMDDGDGPATGGATKADVPTTRSRCASTRRSSAIKADGEHMRLRAAVLSAVAGAAAAGAGVRGFAGRRLFMLALRLRRMTHKK